jgi:hypothetical protein
MSNGTHICCCGVSECISEERLQSVGVVKISDNCEFQEPELQASPSASVTATSEHPASRRG